MLFKIVSMDSLFLKEKEIQNYPKIQIGFKIKLSYLLNINLSNI